MKLGSMQKLAIIYISLLTLFFLPLFCRENDPLKHLEDFSQSVELTDGLPSNIINESVSVISGEYMDNCTDIVLQGPRQLIYGRTYLRRGQKIADVEEARKLILTCVQEFLNEANSNEDFRPLMKVYPFTEKNISIIVIFYDEEGRDIHYPYISSIIKRATAIDYTSMGPTVYDPYAQEITETYEEALERAGSKPNTPDVSVD